MTPSKKPEYDAAVLLAVVSQLGTALPYVSELLKRGRAVCVFAPREVIEAAKTQLQNSDSINFHTIDSLPHRPTLRKLHLGFLLTFVDPNFSPYFRHLSSGDVLVSSRLRRILAKYRYLFPRLNAKTANKFLHRVFSCLISRPFRAQLVIAISKSDLGHLICAGRQTVITIADSWDHAVGVPHGYVSDLVVGWNRDLSADWVKYQGARNILPGFPMRLRYAYDGEFAEGDTRQWLYPFGSSSSTRDPSWFPEEKKVARFICKLASQLGCKVLLKPHPAGRRGELDVLDREFSHVEIGSYGDHGQSNSSHYQLSETYNDARKSELSSCGLVFNLWTTFGLDAAIAGRPVCQLDLRESRDFPAIAGAMSGLHLRDYLLGLAPNLLLTISDLTANDGRANDLQSLIPVARSYSEMIRKWLVERSPEAAVQRFADEVERCL